MSIIDPNANLSEQSDLLEYGDWLDPAGQDRMSALRLALRAWMASGGEAPTWRHYPHATRQYRLWASYEAGKIVKTDPRPGRAL